jgi:hypothetical protein
MSPRNLPLDDELEQTARRRAGAKLGWYVHAMVYLCVNLMLAGIALATGRTWAIYPFLGWGLGLAIHGVVIWMVTGGGGLQERLIAAERARIDREQPAFASGRDPW